MSRIHRISLGLAVAALAIPGTAFAQSGDSVDPSGTVAGTGSAGGGTLPFTGLNLALILMVAVGLLVLGLVLRNRGRSEA